MARIRRVPQARNSQARAYPGSYPVGPGAVVPREWVRATDSILTNGPPDGWMASNGPVWWVGSDNAWSGRVGPAGPQWDAYGVTLPPDVPTDRHGFYGGRPVQGHHLTGRGVLGAVTRATNLIVGNVIRTEWKIHKSPVGIGAAEYEIGPVATGTPLWIADPQLTGAIPGGVEYRDIPSRPNQLGPHDFWRTLLTHSVWFGAGAMLYQIGSGGQPLAGTLRIVNPANWGVADHRYVLHPDSAEPLTSDADGVFYVDGQAWHMRVLRGMPPMDDSTAGGALTRSGLVLLAGENLNSYLATTLQSGVPAGVLKVSTPNFTGDDAAALKQRWMQAHGVSGKSVAVLNATVDFQPLSLSVVDADIVRAKGANLVDIAHAFGLSSVWLDASIGGTSITYANISDRRRDLVDHTLADWGRSVEDFISALLPYGQVMRINWLSYITPLPQGISSDMPPMTGASDDDTDG